MSLKDAIQKLSDEIKDLSSIEVTTYTGSLTQVVDGDTGEIDWDKFKPSSGELILAAATRIEADYDTVNFQANAGEDISDLDSLLKLHLGAVESAQAGRAAILSMFKGLIKLD